MLKILAVDLDGTCLNSKKKISKETLETLKYYASKNTLVIPTTGRNLECVPHELMKEDFFRYVITSNGARIYDLKENKVLYLNEINREIAALLLQDTKDLRIATASHINNQYFVQGRLFYTIGQFVYQEDAKSIIKVKDMLEHIKNQPHNIEEIQLYFFDKHTKDKLIHILNRYPSLSYAMSDNYIEIYSYSTSKGQALQFLSNHLQIQKDEIACIGDSENDMSMFDIAGYSLAMGNAIPELKAKATHILKSNDENGIADSLTYLKNLNI